MFGRYSWSIEDPFKFIDGFSNKRITGVHMAANDLQIFAEWLLRAQADYILAGNHNLSDRYMIDGQAFYNLFAAISSETPSVLSRSTIAERISPEEEPRFFFKPGAAYFDAKQPKGSFCDFVAEY